MRGSQNSYIDERPEQVEKPSSSEAEPGYRTRLAWFVVVALFSGWAASGMVSMYVEGVIDPDPYLMGLTGGSTVALLAVSLLWRRFLPTVDARDLVIAALLGALVGVTLYG